MLPTVHSFWGKLESEIMFPFFLSGIPQCFSTVGELITVVTMVLFTASGQYAYVNNRQVMLQLDHFHDVLSFAQNLTAFCHISLWWLDVQLPQCPLKAQTSEETAIETLPNQGSTLHIL